jgi:hypothetical protein
MMPLLLAGTILAPTQASGLSKFNSNTDTSSLKHAIREGVNVNLEHRDQHMDQENLCYRDNTCRQSDVGQNTLGNDNSVTGFADQSDNTTTNNTSTANSERQGSPGAKGDPGAQGLQGDPGSQGPVGPAGPPRTLVVTDRTSDLVDVAPNSTASAEAPCDVSLGEKVTGGGFAFSSVRIVGRG